MRYCSSMKPSALAISLSMTSTLFVSGALADAQRSMPGTRPSTRPAPPPPTIRTPIQPPVVQPAPPINQLPPPSSQSSPFDARPRTYAPRYDPRYNRNPRRGGYYAPYYSGGFSLDDVTQAPADQAALPVDSNGQPIPSLQIPPPVVLPHAPDTYYVIPGCYAGNHPPVK